MSAGRRSRALSGVLTALVGLALVAAMAATAPDLKAAVRSWQHRAVGEVGELRDLRITVTDAGATRTMDVRGEPLVSEVAFVVVQATASPTNGPLYLNRVWLSTRDGRQYEPRGEWVGAQPQIPVQPGFSAAGSWVFEVPDARLAGAALVVENDGAEFDGYDRSLRIDLGLDTSRIDTRPIALPEPRVWVSS